MQPFHAAQQRACAELVYAVKGRERSRTEQRSGELSRKPRCFAVLPLETGCASLNLDLKRCFT